MFNKQNTSQKESLVEENIEKMRKENEELFLKLTNKNQDYFVQLDRKLDDLSYDSKEKIVVLNQMFLETVEFQEDAITARRMYGTVTEKAHNLVESDAPLVEGSDEISPSWMIYMDGALLFGGMLSLINGFGSLLNIGADPTASLTLVQLIMNFALGGLVAMALNKYKPQPGKTKGMLKYTGVTVASILGFVLIITLAQVIVPPILNPQIPPFMIIAIGVIGLLLKWYLKKELDIKGTLF